MKSVERFLPNERRAVSILSSIYAMRMLGLFMVLPVFILEGQVLQGATPALLGFALGVYGLTQALLQIPFGALSDRFGRKRMILLGLLIFAGGSVVAALSESIMGVIVGRALQGAGAIASVLMALVSDLTREEQRTKAMASIGMTIGLSFGVALVLGPILAAAYGLSGLFWCTAALAGFGILLLLKLPRSVPRKAHLDTRVKGSALRQVLRTPQLMQLNLGIFALHMILTGLFIALPVTLSQTLEMETSQHGWLYLAVMGLGFVAMVPFIILGEKRRQVRKYFRGGVGALVLSLIALVLAPAGFWSVVATLLIFFAAFNFLEATLPSLVSKVAPAGMRGTAMGAYSASQFMGAFLGGSLGGLALSMAGVEGVYGLCLAFGLLWLLLTIWMPEPPYTASFAMALKPFNDDQAEEVSGMLETIPGVEDVTLVIDEHLAYLKIDKKHLDVQVLRQHPLAANADG